MAEELKLLETLEDLKAKSFLRDIIFHAKDIYGVDIDNLGVMIEFFQYKPRKTLVRLPLELPGGGRIS